MLPAVITNEHLTAAGVLIDAVLEGIGGLATVHAVTELHVVFIIDAVAELHVHTLVKDIEGAFPQSLVAELFAVADNAAVDLIDLFEAAVLHQRGENLAANTAGAVGDYWLVLHPVVLAGLQLINEVVRGFDIRDDGVFEFANFRFHGISSVEEDNLITAFFNQLVDFFRLEVDAATDDAVGIDLEFTRSAEGHNFVADLHRELREVLSAALTPLELHGVERGILLRLLDVLLARIQVTADGAVDAVFGDQDSALES